MDHTSIIPFLILTFKDLWADTCKTGSDILDLIIAMTDGTPRLGHLILIIIAGIWLYRMRRDRIQRSESKRTFTHYK